VNVAHDPVAAYNFNNITYCEPAFVMFDESSQPVSGTTLTYDWDFGDGGTSGDPDPSHIFQSYGDYPVTLTITNAYNCQDTAVYMVIVKPIPTPVPFFSPQNPSTLNPDVTFWDESYPNIVSWQWETGDGGVYSDPTFMHTYPSPGTFDASLTVTNEWGCTDSIHFTITVVEETSIYIPNTFTPDGNDRNDVFKIYGTNWREMELRIFDRWGEEIFFSDDPNKGWNGAVHNQGEIVMNGTYAYTLYVLDYYGKEYNYKGHVNLIR
jgi:gliding motility-associated-like protein